MHKFWHAIVGTHGLCLPLPASMPEGALLSLENFDSSTHGKNESNDEKEIRAKRESILPCNIHEGLFDASGESNEEERTRISPIKPKSTPEATMIREQHTAPSTSETTPPLTSNCEGKISEMVCFGALRQTAIILLFVHCRSWIMQRIFFRRCKFC